MPEYFLKCIKQIQNKILLKEISFKPSATDTGFLVLQKDNPSGLPEHDQEVRYPIRFR